MDDVTPVIAALQRSGFPLQARVEYEIHARSSWWLARCGIRGTVVPIRTVGSSLSTSSHSGGGVVLVIKYKRLGRRMAFLRPRRQ